MAFLSDRSDNMKGKYRQIKSKEYKIYNIYIRYFIAYLCI